MIQSCWAAKSSFQHCCNIFRTFAFFTFIRYFLFTVIKDKPGPPTCVLIIFIISTQFTRQHSNSLYSHPQWPSVSPFPLRHSDNTHIPRSKPPKSCCELTMLFLQQHSHMGPLGSKHDDTGFVSETATVWDNMFSLAWVIYKIQPNSNFFCRWKDFVLNADQVSCILVL